MTHKQFVEELNRIYQHSRSQPEIDEAKIELFENTLLDLLWEKDAKERYGE